MTRNTPLARGFGMRIARRIGLLLSPLLLVGLTACGGANDASKATSGNPSPSASPSSSVQIVSDDTICDLLFRTDGVMEKSTALLRQRETEASFAAEARGYADDLEDISQRAGDDKSAKIDAYGTALRAYASWIDSPTGHFTGSDLSAAGLEIGNSCGIDEAGSRQPASSAPAVNPSEALATLKRLAPRFRTVSTTVTDKYAEAICTSLREPGGTIQHADRVGLSSGMTSKESVAVITYAVYTACPEFTDDLDAWVDSM